MLHKTKRIRTPLRILIPILVLMLSVGLTAACSKQPANQTGASAYIVTPAGGTRTEGEATPVGGPTGGGTVESGEPSRETPDAQRPLAGIRICIDAGHQGTSIPAKEACAPWSAAENPDINNTTMKAGATAGGTGVSSGIEEYKTNLAISLKLRTALEALGADVLMVRETNDTSISNQARALLANEHHCDITLNIHCNGASNESVTGIELYVRGDGDRSAAYAARSAAEAAMGEKLLDRLTAATGAKRRSVNRNDTYTGINWRDHPTFIVECGFLSNPEEDALLNSDAYQAKLVEGFVQYFLEDYMR